MSFYARDTFEEELLVELLPHKRTKYNVLGDTWAQLAQRMNETAKERGLQCREFAENMVRGVAKKCYLDPEEKPLIFTEEEKNLLKGVMPAVQSRLLSIPWKDRNPWRELASHLNQVARDRGLICRKFIEHDARAILHQVTGSILFISPVLARAQGHRSTYQRYGFVHQQSYDVQPPSEKKQQHEQQQHSVNELPSGWQSLDWP
jgi:hypothetical protein